MTVKSKVLVSLFCLFAYFSTVAVAGGVFRYANGSEPKDIDPHVITGDVEHHIVHSLFVGLTDKDAKTAKPIPGVAEKWTVSKDGKHYSFTLRKDVKWTNGEPVTAHDFVYAWQRALKPATAAEYASALFVIKGGKQVNSGEMKDLNLLGVHATGDYQLEVDLEGPTPYFLGLVARPIAMPVHKATVEKHGQKWTLPANIVSNGAFQLEKWEINRVLRVKKNPTYFKA